MVALAPVELLELACAAVLQVGLRDDVPDLARAAVGPDRGPDHVQLCGSQRRRRAGPLTRPLPVLLDLESPMKDSL